MTYFRANLADDWQQAPFAPVISLNGVQSQNFDNFADDDFGTMSEYYDIPTHFPNTYIVDAGSDWNTFLTEYNKCGPGDRVLLRDGNYTWGNASQWMQNTNGTAENPIYIVAETMHGAHFTGTQSRILMYEPGVVFAGLWFDNVTAGAGDAASIFMFRDGYQRITACKFTNPSMPPIDGPNTYAANETHYVIDNCELDWQGNNAKSAFFSFNSFDNVAGNAHPFWIHHNYWHSAGAGTTWDLFGIGLGQRYAPGYTWNNTKGNNFDVLFENNSMVNYPNNESGYQIKSGTWIFRHNKFVGITDMSPIFRLSNNILFYGNWFEGGRGYTRLSADLGIMAFNFIHTPTGAALYFHPGEINDGTLTTEGIYAYVSSSDWVIQNNIFNGHSYAIQHGGTTGNTILEKWMDYTIIWNNHFKGTSIPLGDTSEQYLEGTGGVFDFAAFTAANTFGPNNYSNTELVPTGDFDPSVIASAGIGDTFSIPYTDRFYGQPRQLQKPSWWTAGVPAPEIPLPSTGFIKDFAADGTVTPFEHTRTSGATATQTDGTVRTYPEGEAAFIDGVGLQIEASATNESYEFDGGWGQQGSSKSGYALGPTGQGTQLIPNTASSRKGVDDSLNTSGAQPYTTRFLVRQTNPDGMHEWIKYTNYNRYIDFNIKDDSAGFVSVEMSGSIEDYPGAGGWKKFKLLDEATHTQRPYIGVGIASADTWNMANYVGDGTDGVQFDGIQREAGTSETSYIQTTSTATGTRSHTGGVTQLSALGLDNITTAFSFQIVAIFNSNMDLLFDIQNPNGQSYIHLYYASRWSLGLLLQTDSGQQTAVLDNLTIADGEEVTVKGKLADDGYLHLWVNSRPKVVSASPAPTIANPISEMGFGFRLINDSRHSSNMVIKKFRLLDYAEEDSVIEGWD